VEFRRPTEQERAEIDRIIFDELVRGQFRPQSRDYFVQVITRLANEDHCDAVILGCTEIPLIITPAISPLPTLDSTRLLARAALRHAVAEGSAAEFRADTHRSQMRKSAPLLNCPHFFTLRELRLRVLFCALA
jgi:Asp/Glu/Hydantoin racemase